MKSAQETEFLDKGVGVGEEEAQEAEAKAPAEPIAAQNSLFYLLLASSGPGIVYPLPPNNPILQRKKQRPPERPHMCLVSMTGTRTRAWHQKLRKSLYCFFFLLVFLTIDFFFFYRSDIKFPLGHKFIFLKSDSKH